MNQKCIIEAVARDTNIAICDAERVFKSVVGTLRNAVLAGETITLRGLVKIAPVVRGRSPGPSRHTLRATVSAVLRDKYIASHKEKNNV